MCKSLHKFSQGRTLHKKPVQLLQLCKAAAEMTALQDALDIRNPASCVPQPSRAARTGTKHVL